MGDENMEEIEFFTKEDAISVEKKSGTLVDYFLFDEYEIHLNRINPHSKQEWHKHSIIEEVIVVTYGEILIKWLKDNHEEQKTIGRGTVVRVKESIHTLENISDDISEFIVYRMVLRGENNREIIKNDKLIISEGQV